MVYLWLMLSFLFQRPLVAGIVVLAIWLAADRAWFRTSTPWRWFQRRQAIAKLRTRLDINPHDRDARFDLAELLVERGEHDEAAALLPKNIEAGDDDVETLWLAGKAVYGSERPDAAELGEQYLAKARSKQPSFRSGAIDLELGRGRLRHGRHDAARTALEHAIEARPGSVEAHVLLARAHAAAGATAQADATRRKAWQLYRESPRFKRRQDRSWAWKAKPIAAVRYYAAVVGVVALAVAAIPHLFPPNEMDLAPEIEATPQEGWNVELGDVPSASRFAVTPGAGIAPTQGMLPRWDLNENGEIDLRRKLFAGDLWCRILTHYPELADQAEAGTLLVEDTQSGTELGIAVEALIYFPVEGQASGLREAALAFETLLESTPPRDCDASSAEDGIVMKFGVKDGEPYERVTW